MKDGSAFMKNEPSGSVIPVPCQHSEGIWPTCYGYIRGRNPSRDEILVARSNMVDFCEKNSLHLARIFHDWNVEPTRLEYPGLLHALDNAGQPSTHSLLLADLEFIREPSMVLTALVETVLKTMPGLKVQCFVDSQAFQGLIEMP